MYSLIRKRTVLFVTFITTATLLLIFNFINRDILLYYFSNSPYFLNWKYSDDISCHYDFYGDVLPSIQDMQPPRDSIFFHETSCRGGLNSRQACSVEAAARKHPHRIVFVLFSSPVSRLVLARSSLSQLVKLRNVVLARVHSVEYAKGTALEQLLEQKENNHSNWRIEHTADLLRYITMYKYGGIYLDTDMLVVKPLDPLGDNWVGREDEDLLNGAAFAAQKFGVGHVIVANVLMDLKADYRPKEYAHNGPGVITRVLLRFCNTTSPDSSDPLLLTTEACHGFTIYNPSKIFPIHHSDLDIYFTAGNLPEYTDDAYMHHFWNKLSKNQTIEKDSPYDTLTRKHCPSIRKMYGDKFGT